MRRQPRLASGAVVVALALLLVAGCGGDPKPKSLPSPTPSPSPSASASATPPALPAAARADSKEGAIALARHYVALVNYAQGSGDSNALKAVEGPHCGSCIAGRKAIADVYGAGGRIVGGRIQVESAQAFRNPGHTWLVTLGVEFEPQTIDWPEPRKDQHPAGGKLPMNMRIGAVDSDWKVLQWSRGS